MKTEHIKNAWQMVNRGQMGKLPGWKGAKLCTGGGIAPFASYL